MDLQKAIDWTDDLVFAKTGRHLDSLQRAILEGTWQNQTYQQVAEDYHCTKDHAKRVASELWQLLSELLEEDVKKSNLKSLLKRIEFSNISNLGSDSTQIFGNINFCSELYTHPKTTKKRSHTNNKESQPRHDLIDAPEYYRLHNRTNELATLKQWILKENSRIVTITGLSGIGKTTLARELLEHIKDNFDHILWRSHRKFSTLNALKTHLIEFLAPPPPTQNPSILNYLRSRSSILDYLRSHRYLIILDDFQETLTPGELVGNYRPEYTNYGKLIKEITRSAHNSCFLLLSWEMPIEIATLETENCYCKTLQLTGLGESATELLMAKELTDEARWLELIHLYSGNPAWLNIIVSSIQDLFNGSVAQFLSYSSLFLGDLEPILQEHYRRLSESEKLVMQWLAKQETAVDISNKPADFLSDSDFLRAIQSLRKRNLIEKALNEKTSGFTLQPVMKEYIKKFVS
ncbi:NB-ARC domain-containing protein [Limnoraphis robusta Tam1]|uniref:NB-ARC domain-containing protein n=1 Tax=Limnoraphis robusta TaxID=1118279 RepID=UPI002B206D99|nr:NB-ARC domain-containing protein [Limnoraphis robusta]MEA5500018.1 NB-ARC domain-containing protein [Limnoraphis robusta BA-68 BA1]MEA5539631.1 NB-ARC domain-containing protein [Limnoraphis robusta Tam1]